MPVEPLHDLIGRTNCDHGVNESITSPISKVLLSEAEPGQVRCVVRLAQIDTNPSSRDVVTSSWIGFDQHHLIRAK
jgi:hypothetical protein